MDTQLVTKQVHLNQWAVMIRDCQESGLTTVDYCRTHGIGIKTYYYRYKKVKEAALETGGFAEIPPCRTAGNSTGDSFVPQLVVSVGDIRIGINSTTPKDLLLDVMRVAKDA